MTITTRTALTSTPEHQRCCKVACELLGPMHRWSSGVKIDSIWANGFMLRARCLEAATADMDELTRVVIAAHRQSVRFEICARPPASTRLLFSCREPGRRSVMTQHPTLDDLAHRVMTGDDPAELFLHRLKQAVEMERSLKESARTEAEKWRTIASDYTDVETLPWEAP